LIVMVTLYFMLWNKQDLLAIQAKGAVFSLNCIGENKC
jgi:hypothetical protein